MLSSIHLRVVTKLHPLIHYKRESGKQLDHKEGGGAGFTPCNTKFPLQHKVATGYTGQSIPIPHSEPFSHLRCGNGSQTYLNLYICI